MANNFEFTMPALSFTGARGSSSPAAIVAQAVTNSYRTAWAFDDTTKETINSVEWTCPEAYTGSGTLKIKIHFVSAATTGTAVFGGMIEAFTPGTDTNNLISTDSFDNSSDNLGSTNLSGTSSGSPQAQTVTMTAKDSIASGDICRLAVYRNVATDGVSGDLFVYAVDVFEET